VHNDGLPLAEIIRREVSEYGPISFARFMELSLYHPVHGYYRRGLDPFGIDGDFYTAEQLTPFGELVAEFMERTGAREVLELGAGRRELMRALSRWHYHGVDWDDTSLPSKFSGVVLANEFFDALPVHLLRRRHGEWLEVAVGFKEHAFALCEREIVAANLREYADRYGSVLPEDALLEVNTHMESWIDRVAERLSDGLFLIVDYGYSAAELVRFADGTLLSYRKHTTETDTLRSPGDADITAHVNFTELIRLAAARGFQLQFEGSLQSWALSLWDENRLSERWERADQRWRLQWKQLVFGMGETFRVLVFKTGSPK
jgi:SAM-dependent MidA family methyltransferase